MLRFFTATATAVVAPIYLQAPPAAIVSTLI
jgi:hypothetical protein